MHHRRLVHISSTWPRSGSLLVSPGLSRSTLSKYDQLRGDILPTASLINISYRPSFLLASTLARYVLADVYGCSFVGAGHAWSAPVRSEVWILGLRGKGRWDGRRGLLDRFFKLLDPDRELTATTLGPGYVEPCWKCITRVNELQALLIDATSGYFFCTPQVVCRSWPCSSRV